MFQVGPCLAPFWDGFGGQNRSSWASEGSEVVFEGCCKMLSFLGSKKAGPVERGDRAAACKSGKERARAGGSP